MATAILAIECGATNSTALLVLSEDNTTKFFKFGPANYLLISLDELQLKLKSLSQELTNYKQVQLTQVGIALPGIFEAADKSIVRSIVQKIWPTVMTIWVGSDLDSALACLQEVDQVEGYSCDKSASSVDIHCILISGTGSCAYGTNGIKNYKVGGNGHCIGDHGSGYSIAHQGLRKSLKEFERNDGNSNLFDSLKRSLNLPTTLELVRWSTLASKSEIASLAPVVLNEWKGGDKIATEVIQEAIEDLAMDLHCLIKKLSSNLLKNNEETSLKVGFTGSILVENQEFRNAVEDKIQLLGENGLKFSVQFKVLQNTVKGSLAMVEKMKETEGNTTTPIINGNNVSTKSAAVQSNELLDLELNEEELYKKIVPIPTALSPTECRNPASFKLDTMSIEESIDLWLNEESSFYEKIGKEKLLLKKLVIQVTNTLRNGGRLFYIGSGTSGRLGILDASECPPTFSTPPHMVQGIISGGRAAIFSSVEGAEDSISGGIRVVDEYGITSKDLVMGIACSGRTPFVWGAICRAKALGAFTAFLTFNPYMILKQEPDIFLAIDIGPEILTGSTRLKSGSATKCILNMITTLSMVQLGKCLENLMIDVNPCNNKLKERALRIVMAIVNGNQSVSAPAATEEEEVEVDYGKYKQSEVQKILVANNYDIKKTVRQVRGEEVCQ